MNRIENVYGLTPAQEGIYAQYHQNKETDAYQLFFLFELNETVSVEILRQAIMLLPARHPVLKTAFAAVKGTLKQVLLADRLPTVETREMGTAFSREALDKAVETEQTRTFDLQKDPLLRCVFILFPDRRFLLLHTHHLIADGWCMPVLFSDLLACAAALSAGESAEALRDRLLAQSKAAPSFADYVTTVRRRDTDAAEACWRSLLADCVPAALPGAVYKTPPETGRKTLFYEIPADLRDRIEFFARSNGLPPNTVLESAFALALQKHTGKDDVLFFKAVSGRASGLPGAERTVGPMLNTVPVRACGKADATATDFIREMNEQSVRANAFGFLSLSEVCRKNGIDPNAVEVLFDFGNYPVPDLSAAAPLRLLRHIEYTGFPLTCMIAPEGNRYCLTLLPDGTRISVSAAQALIKSFLSILDVLCSAENVLTVSACRALTDEERARIAAFAAGSEVPIPEKSIYELFSAQAEAEPDLPRITDGGKTYTFADLKLAAEKTDAFIRTRVGDQKQVIGVLCDRSFAALAAIYGIVRGGSAYLPLSPEYPPERIRILLEQANCGLVLADEKYLSLTPKAAAIGPVLAAAAPEVVVPPNAEPGDTLYVIFTSGSTGMPKGAMVSNRSAVNRIRWMARRYWDKNTVVMLKTPFTFDVSVWEIFGFAAFGFSLHILPPDDHYRMAATLDAIEKGSVTDLHFVPTVFGSFLEYLQNRPEEREKLRSLKNVFLSGETLHAVLVNEFCALSPAGVKLHNLYGPAECAVDVTYYDCGETERDPVPIGKPVDNTRIYVLDGSLQPVPSGVTGQICIAGANVGQGYLGDPERTAVKFVNDPFGEGKLYLTGDLGYWEEDGNLVFAGRNDFQVKINGQRVEPGEIEAAMRAIGGVTGACVIIKRDPDRITAFYTGTAAESDVRNMLAGTLPPYMRPSAITRLAEMPLNANGKTDRGALAAMLLPSPEAVSFEPPETETEKAVCKAFSQILGVEEVGRRANFFELGGTSLLLIRLLSLPPLDALSPSAFLADPTPAGTAKRLDAPGRTDYTVLAPLYTPADAKRAIVLFPYAGGDASAYAALAAAAKQAGIGISLWFADWPEDHEWAPLERELRQLAQNTTVWFYSHCAGSVLAMKLLDRLNAEERLIERYIAGGSIPSGGYFNLWAHLPDGAIRKLLEKAGLSADQAVLTRERLARFRAHTQLGAEYFRRHTEKTRANVTVIVSQNDPLTANYAETDSRWRKVVTDVERVILIDTPSHYFQNTDTDLLLKLFSE